MKKFLKVLQQMKGKTYQYAGKIHYIVDYTIDEQREKVTLKTNLQTFERPYESMDEFLNYWTEATALPATVNGAGESNRNNALVESETNLVDDLTQILKENIEKVQKDPGYIKQAQAVNNNVNSIINLTKLKLDVLKFSKGRKN